MLGLAIVAVALTACSQKAITTEEGATAKIAGGTAINSQSGSYEVGGVDVSLVKVVELPSDELGMQFEFHWSPSALGTCCKVFPRDALDGEAAARGGGASEFYVSLPRSFFGASGTLLMLLTNGSLPSQRLGHFTLDLASLGVDGFVVQNPATGTQGGAPGVTSGVS